MHARHTGHRIPPLGLVGIFLAFAVVIALTPYTVVIGVIRLYRLRTHARRSACQACGGKLGRAALNLSADAHADALDEAARTKDFARWKMAKKIAAVCPTCGAYFSFDETRHIFVPVYLRPIGVRT
jgi:hypothetical protein